VAFTRNKCSTEIHKYHGQTWTKTPTNPGTRFR